MSALAAAGEDVLALKLLKEMPNMQARVLVPLLSCTSVL